MAIKKKNENEMQGFYDDLPSSNPSGTGEGSVPAKPNLPTPSPENKPQAVGGVNYLDQALEMLSKAPEATYTPGTYQSQYSEKIDSIINDILESKYQGYNAENDPTYSQYKKSYLREADRTAEDVLGKYAAMNSGMPSTAAISAASQAGNYFKGQLADKIPELETAAYNRYLSELSGKRQNLSDLTALEELAYGRFTDEEARKLAEYQQKQSEYDTALNRLLQGAEIEQTKEGLEANRALSQLNYGVMPSAEGLKALGIDEATAKALIGLTTASGTSNKTANTGLSEDTILKLLEYSAENGVSPSDALLQFEEIASTSGTGILGDPSKETASQGLAAIKKKASSFTNVEELDNYLTRLHSNGLISKEEVFAIYEELLGEPEEQSKNMMNKLIGAILK